MFIEFWVIQQDCNLHLVRANYFVVILNACGLQCVMYEANWFFLSVYCTAVSMNMRSKMFLPALRVFLLPSVEKQDV